jgi:hypothetical protein
MIEVVVIVESRADAVTATKLAERILVEKVDWLEPEILKHLIEWTGLDLGTSHSCWQDVGDIIKRAQASGVRVPKFLGHGRTGKFKADGAAAMKVLNLIRYLQRDREIKGVMLIRDLDNQQERRKGIEQAQAEHADIPPQLAIIIGTADRMREAWVLNGFQAIDRDEERILADLIAQLNFDPCENAHKLRSNSFAEPDRDRNPKVILDRLTNEDDEDGYRKRQCWEETALEILRSRGKQTGLTDYLEEIEQRLLPLING